MSDTFISESIKYIGADDTTLDLFESQYQVPNGVSYNSYVILDEKVAVMDTIDARKSDEWFANLSDAHDERTKIIISKKITTKRIKTKILTKIIRNRNFHRKMPIIRKRKRRLYLLQL